MANCCFKFQGQLFSFSGSGSEEFIEVANYAALPATGSTSVIYVTLDDNKLYRWTGSTYVELSGMTIDANPTDGSANAVSSNGVFDALGNKQNNLTASNLHTFVDALTALTSPADADRMIIVDNSASLSKKITWTNIKATLKTYFDTIYTTTSAVASQITTALIGYATQAYADAKVTDAIVDGVTTVAPSQNAVFDALALKQNIAPSVQSVVSSATVTPVYGNDLVVITAQAAGLTLANPTGSWVQGKDLVIRIKDNATPRAITYDTKYRAIGVTLPTTTVASKTTYLGIIYNSTDDTFDVIGVTTQA